MMAMAGKGGSDWRIKLGAGGDAYAMGGTFVLLQRDPTMARRPMQNVVVALEDLETLRHPAGAATVALEDGEAYHMGDGLWVLVQADETKAGRPVQNVVVTANDVETLLAA